MVAAVVGRRHLRAAPAPTPQELQRELGLAQQRVAHAIAALVAAGVLAESGDDRRLLPARDLSTLSVAELWRIARGHWPQPSGNEPMGAEVARLMRGIEEREGEREQVSVRDWLLGLSGFCVFVCWGSLV